MSSDYYLVPGTAKMHILTNGVASFGDASFNINGSYKLNVAGPVNVQGIYSSKNSADPSNTTYSVGSVIQIPADSSANRPPVSLAGYIRYNNDTNTDTIEYYNQSQNQYLPIYAPPLIYSVSPNNISTGGLTYTITGQGFGRNVTVYFIGIDGITTFSSPSVTSNASTTITAVAPQYFTNNNVQSIALEPWSVRVLNNVSGLSNTSFYSIYGDLSWNTPPPFSTIIMKTSYYYGTGISSSPAPATIFSINTIFSTVYFKFDTTLNLAKINYYKLLIYNGTNAGYLTTSADGATPGNGPVPNGSTTTTDTFQIGVISYYISGATQVQISEQYFYVSVTPTWLPTLTITSGSPIITSYGSSPSYRVYTFGLGTTTFTIGAVSDPSLSQVDMLIVGGGGGGGGGYQGGGGGGGAVISTTGSLGYCGGTDYGGLSRNPPGLGPYTINTGTNVSPSLSTVYTAGVGAGGAGAYYNYSSPYSTPSFDGSASYFSAGSTTLFQAIGGGAGGYELNISSNPTYSIHSPANKGGCGGGNSHWGPQTTITTPPPYFSVLPGGAASAIAFNNVATNIVTINGVQYSGASIPDLSNNNGQFGYIGGSGISSNAYTGYPNIFLGGGGGGAGGGLYGNAGDPNGTSGTNQLYQNGQINAFNNYNWPSPNGSAYIPPGTTSTYANNYGISGNGGNGITNSITGSSLYYSPGGGGAARVGNNQVQPTAFPGIVASNGGLGQAGYGQGFIFYQNQGSSNYSNATSAGNPNVPGAGGGSGGAPDESQLYNGMTAGSGTAGCVILRYRIS